MVDTSPEIKIQPPQTLEISGYWNPTQTEMPERRIFINEGSGVKIEILSRGVLGTREIIDENKKTIIQDDYHLTEGGQVVRVRIKKAANLPLSSTNIDIVGSNGRIEIVKDQDETTKNRAKLIYEPRVTIK